VKDAKRKTVLPLERFGWEWLDELVVMNTNLCGDSSASIEDA
jgi:hypothetical protein